MKKLKKMKKSGSLFCISLALLLGACSEEKKVNKLKLYNKVERLEHSITPPQVDILFVVDNKNLSSTYRRALVEEIGQFTGPLQENRILNFRLGVVTSAKLKDAPCGNKGWIGSPTFVERVTSDSNLTGALRKKLQWRGSLCGSFSSLFHHPFEAVVNKRGAEFFRPRAHLVVIFVTDKAAEGGDLKVSELKAMLLQLKGHRRERIALYGAIVKKNDPLGCLNSQQRVGGLPLEIEDLIAQFGGSSFNLCSPLIGEELEKIARSISQKFGELFIPFKAIPAQGTLQVEYKGQIIPQKYEEGWTYDPNRKGVRVGTQTLLSPHLQGNLEIKFYPSREKAPEKK